MNNYYIPTTCHNLQQVIKIIEYGCLCFHRIFKQENLFFIKEVLFSFACLLVCLFVCFQQAEAIRESHHYPLGAHAQLINLQLTPYAWGLENITEEKVKRLQEPGD